MKLLAKPAPWAKAIFREMCALIMYNGRWHSSQFLEKLWSYILLDQPHYSYNFFWENPLVLILFSGYSEGKTRFSTYFCWIHLIFYLRVIFSSHAYTCFSVVLDYLVVNILVCSLVFNIVNLTLPSVPITVLSRLLLFCF